MSNTLKTVTYPEFMNLLTNDERELFFILQCHGVTAPAAHEIMALNKILTKFYKREIVMISDIVKTLNKCQDESFKKLKILREC